MVFLYAGEGGQANSVLVGNQARTMCERPLSGRKRKLMSSRENGIKTGRQLADIVN